MNRQEVYNKVKNHLLTQLAVSEIEVEFTRNDGTVAKAISCAYRGPNGRMCGIGCLILDEHFRPEINGDLVTDYKVWKALQASGVIYQSGSEDEKFLLALQKIHDDQYPQDWAEHLTKT